MDKWLDELGIYDFLGVVCPAVFFMGMTVIFLSINDLCGNIDFIKNLYDMILSKDNIILLEENQILQKIDTKYFIYIFYIVFIYVLGMFLHEIGHICMEIFSLGIWRFCRNNLLYFVFSNIKVFLCGNFANEETYMQHNICDSNNIERKEWFKLMFRDDFGNETFIRYRKINFNQISLNFEDKLKYLCYKIFSAFTCVSITQRKYIKDKYIKEISAAFFQHCKRVVYFKKCGKSSKKKKAIYGLARNIAFVFWLALVVLIYLKHNNLLGENAICVETQMILYIVSLIVFSCKAIRYKNMEIVDVMRTYRCLTLIENGRISFAGEKQNDCLYNLK